MAVAAASTVRQTCDFAVTIRQLLPRRVGGPLGRAAMTALVPAAAAPPGGPAGLLDAERLHAALPGLAVVVRWTRTGSLRFAWSEVTSHVERDLVEATIWSGDPAESPVYGVIDGWSALFDLAAAQVPGLPSRASHLARPWVMRPGSAPDSWRPCGTRRGGMCTAGSRACTVPPWRLIRTASPGTAGWHGSARWVTQDAGGRRSTRCALDEPATLDPGPIARRPAPRPGTRGPAAGHRSARPPGVRRTAGRVREYRTVRAR